MSILLDGQLAATATAIIDGNSTPVNGPVNLTLTNVGGLTETVVLTMTHNAGTARRLARVVLATNEMIVVTGLPINPGIILLGTTTNASSVDYLVAKGSGSGPLNITCIDANGAVKSTSSGLSSAIGGNLTVTGTATISGGTVDLSAAATGIVADSTTGLKVGTATTQKLGFYNTTPIVQRSGSAQAAVTTTVSSAVATTAATNTTPFGYAQAQADAIVANLNALRVDVLALTTLTNELRAWCVAQGLIKGSA